MRRLTPPCTLLVLLTVAGCASQFVPPGPPISHGATSVVASFGRTWDATVDFFAGEHIPVATLDKSSGFIVTERQPTRAGSPGVPDQTAFADCGKYSDALATGGALVAIQPSYVSWNLVVRGDSATSTVRAAARFTGVHVSSNMAGTVNTQPIECSSKGAWEADVERSIKALAERKAP